MNIILDAKNTGNDTYLHRAEKLLLKQSIQDMDKTMEQLIRLRKEEYKKSNEAATPEEQETYALSIFDNYDLTQDIV
jgi:arsenate reductase-like glutaredoxin family protein